MNTIKIKAISVNEAMQKRWTQKEITFFTKHYPEKGKRWCCKQLKRTDGSIRHKASDLKLRQNHGGEFFKQWQARAAKSHIGIKRPEHSLLMKRLFKEGRLPGIGISNPTEEHRKLMSDRGKKWIKEKGHPRGMLGKTHTPEERLRMSERGKAMWRDPNSKVNSEEYRQALSDRSSRDYWVKNTQRMYSNGRMGTYDINGKSMFFRSLWEVNYALYLDFLIKQKQIKGWEYEAETFWFEKIRRGVRSYKPDFKVLTNDGCYEYHEVKGWMDAKSKTKLSRMMKYYPDIKVVLIEKDTYKDLKNKIGRICGFYE